MNIISTDLLIIVSFLGDLLINRDDIPIMCDMIAKLLTGCCGVWYSKTLHPPVLDEKRDETLEYSLRLLEKYVLSGQIWERIYLLFALVSHQVSIPYIRQASKPNENERNRCLLSSLRNSRSFQRFYIITSLMF